MNKWQLLQAAQGRSLEKQAFISRAVGAAVKAPVKGLANLLLGRANKAGKRFITRRASTLKPINAADASRILKKNSDGAHRVGDQWYRKNPRFGGLAGVAQAHPIAAAGTAAVAHQAITKRPKPAQGVRQQVAPGMMQIPQEYQL